MRRRRIREQDTSKGIYDQLPNSSEEEEETTVGQDVPIDPSQQMATQLSTERPPIEDDEFVPASVEELGRAAQAVAEAVPSSEIEWYYRQLHKLADDAVDRSATPEESEEKDVKEESLTKLVRNSLYEILSEQTKPYYGSSEDEAEFDDYRTGGVDYFGEIPEPAPTTPDAVSLEDLAAEFGYSGAPGIRQELGRLTDRMEYFATKVKRDDLNALTDYAAGEYIDAMEASDLLDAEDVDDLRKAPQVVKDLDSFRFFFVSAFVLPAYKEVSREANKRIKAEIDDLGLPKEVHQTVYNQVSGGSKQDPAFIQKKLNQLVKKGNIKPEEVPEIEEKVRAAMSVLRSAAELSDDLVQKSLDKWQGLSAAKRKALLNKSLEQTADFQEN